MTAFDKAWGVAKTRGFNIKDHNGEEDPADPPSTCIKCGSDSISRHTAYDWDGGFSYRVFCEESDCEAKWYEIWREDEESPMGVFDEIQMIESGDF
jgi:hypothetical protein